MKNNRIESYNLKWKYFTFVYKTSYWRTQWMSLSRERLQCKYVQSSMLMLAPPSFLSPPSPPPTTTSLSRNTRVRSNKITKKKKKKKKNSTTKLSGCIVHTLRYIDRWTKREIKEDEECLFSLLGHVYQYNFICYRLAIVCFFLFRLIELTNIEKDTEGWK